MVDRRSVHKQLQKLGFKTHGWGRGEVAELHHIILPGEEIYECVNGIYDGGFALLLATDVRVLLIDKKPLNYLTVEDLRFDMINEIDYSHRLLGARISIATGNKDLKFMSFNQQRLRKLIGHVQHCMAEVKKKQSSHAEDQSQHLEKINQQLQAYLMAQHQYQLQMQQQQAGMPVLSGTPTPPRPANELSDYLFAQSLMAQHQADTGITHPSLQPNPVEGIAPLAAYQAPAPMLASADNEMAELYKEGLQEVFGKHSAGGLEINPMKIAYSKLPMALRDRKFGRPSFHVPLSGARAQKTGPKIPAPAPEA